MSQMRDLPPIAGAIIWARQIERQLLTYMKRVEDVLGKGWELYAEGQKLQSESAAFRRKLDTSDQCSMHGFTTSIAATWVLPGDFSRLFAYAGVASSSRSTSIRRSSRCSRTFVTCSGLVSKCHMRSQIWPRMPSVCIPTLSA
jgi:hypothetical protein